MQKKLCLSILSFILILSFAIHSAADQFSDDVEKLIYELSSKLLPTRPIAVGLGSLFYGDSKISSDFAYHFASEVESAATNVDNFTLIARARLNEILKEQELQMTDLIDPDTVKRVGKITGLDATLTGSYSIWEEDKVGVKTVRIKAKLIRIEDAHTFAVTALIGGIPKSVTIKPPDYEAQKQRINEKIKNWLPERPNSVSDGVKPLGNSESISDFHVTIEPDRTEAYRRGEELTLYVKSNVDCYIEIYDIAPDGSTHLIFPNEYWLDSHSQNDNFIQANVRTPIPYDSSFNLEIFPPFGTDTMKLIASTKPFSTRTRSFYRGKGFPKIGDIDHSRTVETLKRRVKAVLAQPGDGSSQEPAKIAQSYCTILTGEK